MAQSSRILFKRHVAPGAVRPTAAAGLGQGEPTYTDPSAGGNGMAGAVFADFLSVGHGGAINPTVLIGAERQMELQGLQTVLTGVANAKLWDLTNFKLAGGANGNVISTDGTGNLGFVSLSSLWDDSSGVITNTSLLGTGRTGVGNDLRINPATNAEITAATPDNIKAVTPAGLRHVLGDLASLDTAAATLVAAINGVDTRIDTLETTVNTLDLGVTTNASLLGDGSSTAGQELRINPATALEVGTGTDNIKAITALRLREVTGNTALLTWATTQNLTTAINEIRDQVVVLQSGVQLVGTYNAPTNTVVNPKAGTLLPGPLVAAQPNMTGWYLNVAGFGVTALPIAGPVGTAMAPGDRVECDGTQWTHVDMGMSAMAANGVSFTPITTPAISATDVQGAIAQLNSAALRSLNLDATNFSGDGVTTPLAIAEIDGGTY